MNADSSNIIYINDLSEQEIELWFKKFGKNYWLDQEDLVVYPISKLGVFEKEFMKVVNFLNKNTV